MKNLLSSYNIAFIFFANIVVLSSVLASTTKKPMRAILSLIMAFLSSAALWMLLQAEFLSLILIIVYIGAVMTLFLFVVMMTDVRDIKFKEDYGFNTALFVSLTFISMIMNCIKQGYHLEFYRNNYIYSKDYSNIKQIGYFTYTNYLLPFEAAGFLLLTAIIVSIMLINDKQGEDNKSMNSSEQLKSNKQKSIKIVNIEERES